MIKVFEAKLIDLVQSAHGIVIDEYEVYEDSLSENNGLRLLTDEEYLYVFDRDQIVKVGETEPGTAKAKTFDGEEVSISFYRLIPIKSQDLKSERE